LQPSSVNSRAGDRALLDVAAATSRSGFTASALERRALGDWRQASGFELQDSEFKIRASGFEVRGLKYQV
jgi:hypothetical protein